MLGPPQLFTYSPLRRNPLLKVVIPTLLERGGESDTHHELKRCCRRATLPPERG